MGRNKIERMCYGNSAYVAKRDALIPDAEAFCDSKLKVADKKDRGGDWSRLFMKTMDRMWRLRQLTDMSEHMTLELSRIRVEQAALQEQLGC